MIPLSVPNLNHNELKYVSECIETNFVSSAGPFVDRFEIEFAQYLGCKRAVAVSNGTCALHLAMIASGVGPGDEVILPNLTFVAPANATRHAGADPVFIDAEWKNLGMCPEKLKDWLEKNTMKDGQGILINKHTRKKVKAIIPVHIFGHLCSIDEINSIADSFNLMVIEDASESLGAKKNNQQSGTFSKVGCFSFNGNKIITSGGGGAVVTNDDKLATKIKHLSTTAKTDDLSFFHDEVGFNYRMVNILAALGVAQLERLPHFLEKKKSNILSYKSLISNPEYFSIYLPEKTEESNHWFYTLLINENKKELKDKIIQYFFSKGIQVRPIWTPMKKLPMYKDCQSSDLSISEQFFQRVINIPCSTGISVEEIMRVAEVINSYCESL